MADQETEEEWVRPTGRNAAIWSHFKESKIDRELKKEKIRVKCNHCPSMFIHSSSTSNYLRHMRSDHPSITIEVKKGATTQGQEKSKQINIATAFVKMKNEPLGKASMKHQFTDISTMAKPVRCCMAQTLSFQLL